jgi:hypothetical protein
VRKEKQLQTRIGSVARNEWLGEPAYILQSLCAHSLAPNLYMITGKSSNHDGTGILTAASANPWEESEAKGISVGSSREKETLPRASYHALSCADFLLPNPYMVSEKSEGKDVLTAVSAPPWEKREAKAYFVGSPTGGPVPELWTVPGAHRMNPRTHAAELSKERWGSFHGSPLYGVRGR